MHLVKDYIALLAMSYMWHHGVYMTYDLSVHYSLAMQNEWLNIDGQTTCKLGMFCVMYAN